VRKEGEGKEAWVVVMVVGVEEKPLTGGDAHVSQDQNGIHLRIGNGLRKPRRLRDRLHRQHLHCLAVIPHFVQEAKGEDRVAVGAKVAPHYLVGVAQWLTGVFPDNVARQDGPSGVLWELGIRRAAI
jgi:hypothetical protein